MKFPAESCRCPCCQADFIAAPETAVTRCTACGEQVRARRRVHETALIWRANQVGRRPVPWRDGVYLLAEDIRSLWNIGSFFRTADGLGVVHLFLTGICGTPPQRGITRTALGADESVSWSYHIDAMPVLAEARENGVQIVALESTPEAVALRDAPRTPRTLIVVGNEIDGVSPELLVRSDRHVHVPMRGRKTSLNVGVAAGLAVWHYTAQ